MCSATVLPLTVTDADQVIARADLQLEVDRRLGNELQPGESAAAPERAQSASASDLLERVRAGC